MAAAASSSTVVSDDMHAVKSDDVVACCKHNDGGAWILQIHTKSVGILTFTWSNAVDRDKFCAALIAKL